MARERPWRSFRWMYRQFVVKRLTQEEIAELAKTDQATISRWLKKHELKK